MRQVMRKAQVISLVLLTTGVMLANLGSKGEGAESNMTGILATIGISLGSGFAAVYTEKVIKKAKKAEANNSERSKYGLAYMQVQMALTSLAIIGVWAGMQDYERIRQDGLWCVGVGRWVL